MEIAVEAKVRVAMIMSDDKGILEIHELKDVVSRQLDNYRAEA